jgi:uncharacterized protein YqeY
LKMRDKFNEALKTAMKAGDKRQVSTLRLILSALKDRDIEARGQGKERTSDDEILQLLQKMIKQRNDSIEAFDKAGRTDLATLEREEKAIIEAYLPSQMSAEETRAAAKAAVAAVGATTVKDMGKVMAELKGKYAGRMDFAKVNAVVKELLTPPA